MLWPVNEEGIKLFVSLHFSSFALAVGIYEACKRTAFPSFLLSSSVNIFHSPEDLGDVCFIFFSPNLLVFFSFFLSLPE